MGDNRGSGEARDDRGRDLQSQPDVSHSTEWDLAPGEFVSRSLSRAL